MPTPTRADATAAALNDLWDATQYLRFADQRMRPFLDLLSPADGAAFDADYQALIREAYPPREIGGRVVQVLPYRRIFAVGYQG
jgi:trans-aconitate methyltransferase